MSAGRELLRLSSLLLLAIFIVASAATSKIPAVKTKVLFLGDSLTEGLGVAKEAAFPALVAAKLQAAGRTDVEFIAAGIGGSTSASAAARMKWHLKSRPNIVILALGGNDGLRGLPVAEMRKNLAATIALAQQNNIKVLLAGMKIPPNYGPEYTKAFEAVFADLARQFKLPLIPFLLEGVGGEPKLNLPDGIHPNEAGHRIVAETVFKHLVPLL